MEWQRLAQKIRTEWPRLFATRREFAERAGISLSSVTELLAGRKTSYLDTTISAVEDALGWEPGSVDLILAGREPIYIPDPDLQRIVRAWPDLSTHDRKILLAVVDAMT